MWPDEVGNPQLIVALPVLLVQLSESAEQSVNAGVGPLNAEIDLQPSRSQQFHAG